PWVLRKAPFLGVCAALLVLLGFLTWRQTTEYCDLNALYTATLKKNAGCWMAHYNLGIVLSGQGETDQAIDHYRQAITLRSEYAKALQISPENMAALSNLAWLLATSADASLRNGSEAVALAERAESASSRSDGHATVLRIVAAAYAEVGRFAEAKETAQKALE